jgi:hypothetical protein
VERSQDIHGGHSLRGNWCGWPPAHLQALNELRRVIGAAAEIDIDVMDPVSGDNDELDVTGLPIRAWIANRMSQLNPQSKVFERDAMEILFPPFLHKCVVSATPKCGTYCSPPKRAGGLTGACIMHTRGTDTITHRSPYTGMMLFSIDKQHTAPTNGHDPLAPAIAPNKPDGIDRATSVRAHPTNGENAYGEISKRT